VEGSEDRGTGAEGDLGADGDERERLELRLAETGELVRMALRAGVGGAVGLRPELGWLELALGKTAGLRVKAMGGGGGTGGRKREADAPWRGSSSSQITLGLTSIIMHIHHIRLSYPIKAIDLTKSRPETANFI
jgi:hypothetical protein